jgi:hypothetical protein
MSFAQSLELAAVQLYDMVITSGKLDATTASLFTTFQSHHRQHGQSYAALAGKAALSRANPRLISAWAPKFQSAGSQTELLRQAFDLENAAAASYTAALARVIGTNPAALVASILPTEGRHAVVFGQALGLSPSAISPPFESTSGAFTPEQYPAAEQ